MNNVLDWTKPHHKFFEEITRIPHGSEHEEQLGQYLIDFANKKGLGWKQYPLGTVIIYKDATPGYEDHPGVVLQAHIDMVCEKNADSDHDFSKDPLKLRIEDGWLYATDTTLGADDGMGVSYILAVLDSEDIPHPPLECIFTVREETELTGAEEVLPEDIKGRRFIGLDDMNGGWKSKVSSAGGQCFFCHMKFDTEAATAQGYKLKIGGLLGGHSGIDIHLERGNAINLGGRVLKALNEELGIRISDVKAGIVDNAIPREFFASFETAASEEDVKAVVSKFDMIFRDELAASDAGVFASVEKSVQETVWDKESSDKYIDFLCIVPTGQRHKSMEIDGLVIASENLSIVQVDGNVVTSVVLMRADRDSFLEKMTTELGIISKLYGMEYVTKGYFPGWAYDANSFMRAKLAEHVKTLMGKDFETIAAHSGLETGFFKAKWPDVDIVVLGAKVLDYHTPKEKMNLASFDECFKLLKMMLESL